MYLRNRLATAGLAGLERLLGQQAAAPSSRRTVWWQPEASAAALQHPELPGLWLLQTAATPADIEAIRSLCDAAIVPAAPKDIHDELAAAEREVDMMKDRLEKLRASLGGFAAGVVDAAEATQAVMERRDGLRERAARSAPAAPLIRCSTRWQWFDYERGRTMAPMRAHPAAGAASREMQYQHLCDFEVFDRAHVDSWLDLETLEAHTAMRGEEVRATHPFVHLGTYFLTWWHTYSSHLYHPGGTPGCPLPPEATA